MLIGCQVTDQHTSVEETREQVVIPDVAFMHTNVVYDRSRSLWLNKMDSSRLSGYINESYSDGTLLKKFSVYEGRLEGVSFTYFPNGKLRFSETYKDGKLHGEVKRWKLDHGYQLVAQLSYQKGKLHGEQKKWYNTGELNYLMQMNEGREEGIQQAFRKNGALYANYEARNGRTFGMKRSNLCYELDNEQVVYIQ